MLNVRSDQIFFFTLLPVLKGHVTHRGVTVGFQPFRTLMSDQLHASTHCSEHLQADTELISDLLLRTEFCLVALSGRPGYGSCVQEAEGLDLG